MEIGIPQDNLTFDASANTITMTGYYEDINREQILKIKNLTTGDTMYDSLFPQKYNITVSTGVITYTYDNAGHADTDILQITVILAESMGYDSTTDSITTTENSPLDGHNLDELLLDAITATANSTYADCAGRGGFTLHVIASGTVDATIQVNHSTDNTSTAPASIGLVDAAGTAAATPITLSAAGEYTYQFANLASAKYIRGRIVVTTGTFTMTLLGRALGGE
jgi:hypothetical protein